jgi:hypothetical protein
VHLANTKLKLSPSQLRLTAAPATSLSPTCVSESSNVDVIEISTHVKPISLFSIKEAATKAEIIWALKNVNNKFSAASCDDIADVFEAMFPGSLPQGFILGRAKLGYLVTEALGPYFKNELVNDVLKSQAYTLCYDETTNKEGKKERTGYLLHP